MGRLLPINKSSAELFRHSHIDGKIKLKAIWTIEHIRNGEVIDVDISENTCTYQGINKLLDVMFGTDSKISNWYVAIFESDSTPSANATYSSPGYTECTAYSETTRPAYQPGSASGGSISNSSNKAEFTFTSSKTIYGASIVNISTKGDTSESGGILYSVDRFSSSKSVQSEDVLKVTVEIGFTLS